MIPARAMPGNAREPGDACHDHPDRPAAKVFHWHAPGGDVFERLCHECAIAAEEQGFILEDA